MSRSATATQTAFDVGKLTLVSAGSDGLPDAAIYPPPGHRQSLTAQNGAKAPASDNGEASTSGLQDQKSDQSIWFVNFPPQLSNAEQAKLKEYMGNVLNYRCWASGRWNSKVQNSPDMPKGDDPDSIFTRNSYLAKVSVTDVKATPWLAKSKDEDANKTIDCETSEFHVKLIEAVLEGFVDISQGIHDALEGILTSLSKTASKVQGSKQQTSVVLERYEYLPEIDDFRSYIRLASFSVSENYSKIETAKSTTETIHCEIEYNDYEAVFNMPAWLKQWPDIEGDVDDASHDFVHNGTIDCPP